VINEYHQDPRKVFTVHNAVYPLNPQAAALPRPNHLNKEKIVTFLGRITMQKGPEYFVEAAEYGVAPYPQYPFLHGRFW
jgi:glycosyltransferase involved in cell wall biosynthesis